VTTKFRFFSDATSCAATNPSLACDSQGSMRMYGSTLFQTTSMIVAISIVMVLIPGSVPAQGTALLGDSLAHALELEKQKDFAGAERIYREASRQWADDPEILKRLGVVCQQQGKHAEAVEALQRILKRAPLYPGANALLATSYYALNRFDKTIEASQQELIANPKDTQARYYLSLALSASGRLFEAIQHLETLQTDDPGNLAVMYQLVVDYKAATQQASQRLARKAPDSEFAQAMRAEALADGERFDEAAAAFKEVLRRNPNFPGIHLALGQLYWRRKDLEKSKEELTLALAEDPNQPLANYYLGDILVTEKEPTKAIPHLETALSTYPDLTRAYWLLGKCFASSGNPTRAIEVFKKALEQDPNYKEVHFQLHEVYSRSGHKEQSQEHLRIFERLTRDEQNKDREQLEESLKKQKE
jgi:tetratricopeptide (TPR) repeat protein